MLDVGLAAVAMVIWTYVALRCWRLHVDLSTFALVLLLLALTTTQMGLALRLPAPGAVSFATAGLILLLLGAWPDRRVR